jgi:hypothetical protein
MYALKLPAFLLFTSLFSVANSQITVYPELVKNGTFTADGSHWTLWNWTDPLGRSANVKAVYKNGMALLDFSQHIDYPTFEYWAVTWSTGPVTLDRRQWYRLQFEAWGSDTTGFNVAILGPWDEVKLTQNFYLSRRSPTVTKNKTLFVYEFRHSYTGLNNDGRISIQMARSPADTIYFDNVSLKGIDEESLTTSVDRPIMDRKTHKSFLKYFAANKEVTVDFPEQNKFKRLTAFSLNGVRLQTWEISQRSSAKNQRLNVKELPLGMVIMTLEGDSESINQSLLISP